MNIVIRSNKTLNAPNGVILYENGSIGPDAERCCNMFLRQFNSLYYKLHFLKRNIDSFCSPFYGIKLWHSFIHASEKDDRPSHGLLNIIKVSHDCPKAVKRSCFINVRHDKYSWQ